MLTAIEGLYADGEVQLKEAPRGIERARVIVTFLFCRPAIRFTESRRSFG